MTRFRFWIFAIGCCGLASCYQSHGIDGVVDAAVALDTAVPRVDVGVGIDVLELPDVLGADVLDLPDVPEDSASDAGEDATAQWCESLPLGHDVNGECAQECTEARLCGMGTCCVVCHCSDTIRIEPGVFWLGSPGDEDGREEDEVRHRVRISRPFMMDRREVTQEAWRRLMGTNPSSFAGCDQCPVETVNYFEALHFANARSAVEGLDPCYRLEDCHTTIGAGCPDDDRVWRRCRGISCAVAERISFECEGWRLPTEAEWEYAARAGSDSPLPGGSTVEDANVYGWCSDAGGTTHPGGQKAANAWGLQDIFGNVYEWTDDAYAPYQTEPDPAVDPLNRSGRGRVMRGGSWAFGDPYCRAANRGARGPDSRENLVGFRLVRTLP